MRGSWFFGLVCMALASLLSCVHDSDIEVRTELYEAVREGEAQSWAPISIESMLVRYEFDPQARVVNARARMRARVHSRGHPIFDLVPKVASVVVDGRASGTKQVRPAGGFTQFLVLDEVWEVGDAHELELTYSLGPSSWLRWTEQGIVDFFWFMNDQNAAWQQGFLERYVPAGRQFDQFKLILELHGLDWSSYRVVANGMQRSEGDGIVVEFPSYYNAAAPFLDIHLRDDKELSLKLDLLGKGETELFMYGLDKSKLAPLEGLVVSALKEMEARFGPYPHDRVIVKVHEQPWGMEFAGATLSAAKTMKHELCHSWIGRGAFPADGNAAWIDEGVCSWIGREQRIAIEDPTGRPPLSGFSWAWRKTPLEAYRGGVQLIAALANEIADFDQRLRGFYTKYRRQPYTHQDFKREIVGDDTAAAELWRRWFPEN